MQKLTLADVALATRGNLLRGESSAAVHSISTDSRTIQPGDFFVPLGGKNFDGHEFIREAARKGARGSLIASGWKGKAEFLRSLTGDFWIVEVAEANKAYQQIAAYYRNLFSDLSVLGVTGSNGKSTTKEMIAAVLTGSYKVLKNEGTLNNLVGVPRTLLALDSDTRIAVLELGTSLPGEIRALCDIARPDVGVLTNIGPSHLEFFGDLDGVALEKGALAQALNPSGHFVVNADDARAVGICDRSKAAIKTFGLSELADIQARDLVVDVVGRWKFQVSDRQTGQKAKIRLGVLGRHNVANALAAIAVGIHYRIALDEMKEKLERFQGLAMRMQTVVADGVTFINDAYNANPQSFGRALETLNDATAKGRKIVVMGDMLELGDREKPAHEQAGKLVAESAAAILVTVGNRAAWAAQAFRAARGEDRGLFTWEDTAQAAECLEGLLTRGDLVLLKGSRGMRMEKILEKLANLETAQRH